LIIHNWRSRKLRLVTQSGKQLVLRCIAFTSVNSNCSLPVSWHDKHSFTYPKLCQIPRKPLLSLFYLDKQKITCMYRYIQCGNQRTYLSFVQMEEDIYFFTFSGKKEEKLTMRWKWFESLLTCQFMKSLESIWYWNEPHEQLNIKPYVYFTKPFTTF
jgi:hypothetical protein